MLPGSLRGHHQVLLCIWPLELCTPNLAQMNALVKEYPSTWKELQSRDFVRTKSYIHFIVLFTDQVPEREIKDLNCWTQESWPRSWPSCHNCSSPCSYSVAILQWFQKSMTAWGARTSWNILDHPTKQTWTGYKTGRHHWNVCDVTISLCSGWLTLYPCWPG